MTKHQAGSELKWVMGWAILIVTLASLPYILGAVITPGGYHFLGLTHNIDDGAVYLSWMRQAADGHFFIRNLFTNEPQAGRQCNLLFLAMGAFAAITRLPLIWVFHLFRVILGVGVICAVWRFSKLFLLGEDERRYVVPIVGLSAGIGWMWAKTRFLTGPVDTWQPEAITFLSIYLNPLFLAGLLLMLGAFYFLLTAQRTGRVRDAACAGLAMFLLANIHSYDVATVACVWTAYLLVVWGIERRFPARPVMLSLLAAAMASPAVGYQFYLYIIDDVFRARANTPTPSPAIWSFLAGYGIVLIGAILGGGMLLAKHYGRASGFRTRIADCRLFLIVWSVIGFAVPYIPVGQQRKLIMGIHVPLSILCAYAFCRLITRLPARARGVVAVALLLTMAASNARFLYRDAWLLTYGRTVTHYTAYISDSELSAIRYLRTHAGPNDVVLAPPQLALFVPALAGRRVYYGHWSETPLYADKIREWFGLSRDRGSDGFWRDLLSRSGATYYVCTDLRWAPRQRLADAFMPRVFRHGETAIYRVERERIRCYPWPADVPLPGRRGH